ncbi:carboxylesterase/lipase family protein [Actinoplanes sp. NPDC020271]|uniref:carboxylesterase/lipase family protein n=1 Tax=Actinoplanes sp. NPDC020271 TaxID=3363896 RepID=UPI0037B6430D
MSLDVRVRGGVLRGLRESGIAVFRGVPFAAPPVGRDRLRAPRPPSAWDGVRPAAQFGPPPPQPDLFGHGAPAGVAGDEWLTVNVWTPDPDPAAKLPVMVWIHGGGYTIGRSGLPQYDGGHLARDGNVVVVTFNYRVGFEGFGHVPGAPPNRGLLDQVALLEWVRDDIAAFGGDPARVTIFGESAGGGSVAALLAMPSAAGLFRGAVAQSVAGTFFTPELAADIAAELWPDIVDPDHAPRPFVPDPPATGTAPDRWGPAGFRSILFAPVVDGDILPRTPWEALAAGASRDVVLIAGHTRDEHRLFDVLGGQPAPITPEQARAALDRIAPGPDGARRYREAYPQAGPGLLHELVFSDWLFRMPGARLAEAHTGRSYLYELTWPAPGFGGALGACHGLDVPLVFGNLTAGQPGLLIGTEPGPDAVALSQRMRSAWTGFAATGDPGWPAYTRDERLTQVFDTRDAVTTYPEISSLRIWADAAFLLSLRPSEDFD